MTKMWSTRHSTVDISPNLWPVSAILGHTLNHVSELQMLLNSVLQNKQSNFLPKVKRGLYRMRLVVVHPLMPLRSQWHRQMHQDQTQIYIAPFNNYHNIIYITTL